MPPPERGPLASALGVDKASATAGAAAGNTRAIAASSRPPLSQRWTQVVSGQHRAVVTGPTSPHSTIVFGGAGGAHHQSNTASTSASDHSARQHLQQQHPEFWQTLNRPLYDQRAFGQPPPPPPQNDLSKAKTTSQAMTTSTTNNNFTSQRAVDGTSDNSVWRQPKQDARFRRESNASQTTPVLKHVNIKNGLREEIHDSSQAGNNPVQSSVFSKRWADEVVDPNSEDEPSIANQLPEAYKEYAPPSQQSAPVTHATDHSGATSQHQDKVGSLPWSRSSLKGPAATATTAPQRHRESQTSGGSTAATTTAAADRSNAMGLWRASQADGGAAAAAAHIERGGGVVYGLPTSQDPSRQDYSQRQVQYPQYYRYTTDGRRQSTCDADQETWSYKEGVAAVADDRRGQPTNSRKSSRLPEMSNDRRSTRQEEWLQNRIDNNRQGEKNTQAIEGGQLNSYVARNMQDIGSREMFGGHVPYESGSCARRGSADMRAGDAQLPGYDALSEGIHFDYQSPMRQSGQGGSTSQNNLMVLMAPASNSYAQQPVGGGHIFPSNLPGGPSYLFYPQSRVVQAPSCYESFPIYELSGTKQGAAQGLYVSEPLPPCSQQNTSHMPAQRANMPLVWDLQQQQQQQQQQMVRVSNNDFIEKDKPNSLYGGHATEEGFSGSNRNTRQTGVPARNILRRSPQAPIEPKAVASQVPSLSPPALALGEQEEAESIAEATRGLATVTAHARRGWNSAAAKKGSYETNHMRYVDHLNATRRPNTTTTTTREVRATQKKTTSKHQNNEEHLTKKLYDNSRYKRRGSSNSNPKILSLNLPNNDQQNHNSNAIRPKARGSVCRHFMSGKCSFEECKFLHPESPHNDRNSTAAQSDQPQQQSSNQKSELPTNLGRESCTASARTKQRGHSWRQINNHLSSGQHKKPPASSPSDDKAVDNVQLLSQSDSTQHYSHNQRRGKFQTAAGIIINKEGQATQQQQSSMIIGATKLVSLETVSGVAAAIAGTNAEVVLPSPNIEKRKKKQRKRKKNKSAQTEQPAEVIKRKSQNGVWTKKNAPSSSSVPGFPTKQIDVSSSETKTSRKAMITTKESSSPVQAVDHSTADRVAQARHFQSSLSRAFHGQGSGSRTTPNPTSSTNSSRVVLIETEEKGSVAGPTTTTTPLITTTTSSAQASSSIMKDTTTAATASTQSRWDKLDQRRKGRKHRGGNHNGGGGGNEINKVSEEIPDAAAASLPQNDTTPPPLKEQASTLACPRSQSSRRPQPWRRRQRGRLNQTSVTQLEGREQNNSINNNRGRKRQTVAQSTSQR